MTKLKVTGEFIAKHYRKGKLIGTHHGKNGVVDVGLNDLLDAGFGAGTQRTWYIGLLAEGTVSGDLSASDTMSSHSGWTEFTDVDEATRQAWISADTASSKTITNATYVEYTINLSAGVSIPGIFITSDNTLGGTSGILWATGLFTDGAVALANDDVLSLTYAITMSAA